MVIRTNIMPPGAAAFTAFPFIFAKPGASNQVIEHEQVHYQQQLRWAIYGVGVGLLLWFVLYLLVLPVWWNPFRARWEREAYTKAQHFSESKINEILRRPPYYLWSL